MEAITAFGNQKTAGLAGSIISVALVFGGASGRAEGITQFALPVGATPGSVGSFSGGDLEQLEHATALDATAVRLAALGADVPELAKVRSRAAALEEAATGRETDLFPHSGRLLPMLVTRPDAAAPVARVAATLRPGLVRPVGVPLSSLRSPASIER